ncbi:hypothetical protein E3156_26770 (plasmid) [Escherichia coli O55:H7]|nr:hypothetical protein E3156_26770 [Escherichia coli O55:H7]
MTVVGIFFYCSYKPSCSSLPVYTIRQGCN